MSHCHNPQVMLDNISEKSIILVGNPNVGKSVVFSRLTGSFVDVSNYPGTTVEVTQGQLTINGCEVAIFDTPGTNGLVPRTPDERVTRDILLSDTSSLLVQIADAKNLARSLLLTTQLLELDAPMVLVLNMQDEAQSRGIQVDSLALGHALGIEVIPAVATRGEGLDATLEAVGCAHTGSFQVMFDPAIEKAIASLTALLPISTSGKRTLALTVLSDEYVPVIFPPETHATVATIRADLAAHYDIPLAYAFNRQRMTAINDIIKDIYRKEITANDSFAMKLGQLAMHPVWGWPILLAVLFGLYQFVGVFGAGTLVDLFESVIFGRWINPAAAYIVERILPPPILQEFLVGEYGVISMALSYGLAIVLPIVLTFFIAFSLLEDTGYLPRLAVVLNRPFKVLGMNGKAVLPMVLGLGCDTMATMTTRILETRKERLLVTLLLALGVPCSAQLGVILGMIGYISPAAMAVWAGVVISVLLAVGWLAAHLIPGQTSDFIIELPPIRAPRFENIFFKTLARVEWYLKEVLPMFILGTVILFILDKVGGLSAIEQLASPLIEEFLGLPRAATSAFLIGFLRRDYGAAGLFALARAGQLNTNQMIVSLVVVTLFIPCIANFLMIIKEYGAKTAAWVTAVVVPLAFAVGGLLNMLFNVLGISF